VRFSEIIYDLKSVLYGGNIPDDAAIENEQIASWFKQAAATIIEQQYAKSRTLSTQMNFETCLELELVDASQCCDITIGCQILRSVLELPPTLPLGEHVDGFIAVSAADNSGAFSHSTSSRIHSDLKSKFGGIARLYWVQNNRLYIPINQHRLSLLRKVLVRVIPEDPLQWIKLHVCGGQNGCDKDPWEAEYPLPVHIVDLVYRKILAERGVTTRQVPEDQLNDARETT
jgi:hypothetical protein